jgi:hypothetical protein
MNWIVDRIEEGIAVCIASDDEQVMIHLPIKYLPGDVQEGDHLIVSIQIDNQSTQCQKAEVDELLEELTKNQDTEQLKFKL